MTEKENKKPKGTIGVITGRNYITGANFVRILVKIGASKFGYKDDQDHPEVINFSAPIKGKQLAEVMEIFAKLKVDVIVTFDDLYKHYQEFLPEDLDMPPIICMDRKNRLLPYNQLKNLAKNILNYIHSDECIRKRATSPEAEMEERWHNFFPQKYSVLKQGGVLGVIGGAGPEASSEFCETLAAKNIANIHFSVNSAPYKYLGNEFVPYYRNAINLLKMLGAEKLTMPCNTAHKYLKEICGYIHKESDFVDIREAIFGEIKQNYPNQKKFILLGTPTTTGVYTDITVPSLYEQKNSDNLELIRPNQTQQKQIMDAIFLVKEGDALKSYEIIMNICKEIREHHNDKTIPVILGCTELHLPFAIDELQEYDLISTCEMLAKKVRSEIKDKKIINSIN